MFNMDFNSIPWTTRVIHQLAAQAVVTKGDRVVVIIQHELIAAVAASGNVEISFFVFHPDKCWVVAGDILIIISCHSRFQPEAGPTADCRIPDRKEPGNINQFPFFTSFV